MPIYEYVCKECGQAFEALVRGGNRSAGKCPKCGSKKLEKQFSVFASASKASGSGGSGACPATGGTCGPGCCPMHRH